MFFPKTSNVAVCPRLVNNHPCCIPNCSVSHAPQDILWWQQGKGRIPCKRRSSCAHLRAGTCLFFHSPSDRLQMDRLNGMVRGLQYLDTVNVGQLGLLVADRDFTTITDECDLASFNKVSDGEIAVPGKPPLFSPLEQPLHVQWDSANKSLGSNFPQYTHSFEPLLRSVEVMQPTMNILDSADVITNASNLRKLFHILRNDAVGAERFDLEWRGKTLLLSKWNKDPSLLYSFGCGAGFEKETCRYAPDDDTVLQRSTSHHRVVSYRFGGLQCIVQSEVDGYRCSCDHSEKKPVPVPVPVPDPIPIPTTPKSRAKKQTNSQSLSPSTWRSTPPPSPGTSRPSPFTLLALDDPGDSPTRPLTPPFDMTTTKTTHPSPTLLIHHTPTTPQIPSPCLIELKTHKTTSLPSFAPAAQLYFTRRTKLYIARHTKALFLPQHAKLVEGGVGDLRGWEEREQGTLRKVSGLLRVLRGRLEGLGEEGTGWSLVCEADGSGREEGVRVRLFERERKVGWGLLPGE